jgi:hypothetical protein
MFSAECGNNENLSVLDDWQQQPKPKAMSHIASSLIFLLNRLMCALQAGDMK